MEVVSLSDLGPVLAATLGPVLAFAVASMRYQHLDALKTREQIADSERETRELITRSNQETLQEATRQFQQLSAALAEHRRETRESFKEITTGLGDARERIARIEGNMGIAGPPIRGDDEAVAQDE